MKELPSAAAVARWKEAVLGLSDKRFFDLMRLYLGPVKTPFNKQRLTDALAAFLRRPAVRENILAGLDTLDLRLISAVRFLHEPDRTRLTDVFSGEIPYPELYGRILNLEERLLIFRAKEDHAAGYRLNPLLEADLRNRADFSFLVSPGVPAAGFRPSPVLLPAAGLTLAGIFAFFHCRKIPETRDASLRKKDAQAFAEIFPDVPASPEILIPVLKRLGLLTVAEENTLVPDFAVWQEFSRLSVAVRTAWLCAAAGPLSASFRTLSGAASVFLSCTGILLPGAVYRAGDVARLFAVLAENPENALPSRPLLCSSPAQGKSRFAALLAAAQSPEKNSRVSMTDAALAFGLLVRDGDFFALNHELAGYAENTGSEFPAGQKVPEKRKEDGGVRNVFADPSCRVTVLPGTPLADFLPAVRFLAPENIHQAAIFCITRESCAAAFADGETPDSFRQVFSLLGADLPENVGFLLDDWYDRFSSLRLYEGIVLKAAPELQLLFAPGGNLSSFVRGTLAPGVYLLGGGNRESLAAAFRQAGLDVPLPESASREPVPGGELRPVFAVPLQRADFAAAGTRREAPPPAEDAGDAGRIQESLLAELDAKPMEDSVRAVFVRRIREKTVVCKTQLDPAAVRAEKTEAGTLDFSGKVRLAEQALREGALLEIWPDESRKTGDGAAVLRPLRVEKSGMVHGTLEPAGTACSFSLGKAARVRILPSPLFS